ncbi:hypothetical protein LTR85_011546 [Meristemomyces frigidus]|nr:hypothetical protein LTR85_011546 [Meristemomyces frigidus]
MTDRQHVLVRHLISRPNPIEPQSVPQRHPLNGTPQLAKGHNSGLARIHLDTDAHNPGDRPAKRRRTGDAKSLDLPKLPVRQGTKRLRIPPTLTGLHQPPPNAGLLPSISTEQPVALAERAASKPAPVAVDATPPTAGRDSVPESASAARTPTHLAKSKRKRWSDEETACLLKGVSRFGIGSWTKILKCSEYGFDGRTALDLKDRFRICCPDDYRSTKHPRSGGRGAVEAEDGAGTDTSDAAIKSGTTVHKSRVELRELGINQPFAQNKRRKRHAYSVEEDEAILRGFRKYGNAWAAIRVDDDLRLEHRTATDLRDRMRTRYPEEYAKAGLAPRPEVFPKPPDRGRDIDNSTTEPSPTTASRKRAPRSIALAAEKADDVPQKPTSARVPHQATVPPLLPYDSVFWGAPFDEEDLDYEPITLDRGILDWPGDASKQSFFDHSRSGAIESLVSLRLPEPMAASVSHSMSHALTGSVLPSVASITAVPQFGMDDQLELPSLMIGALEPDGRAGGHFLGFDELLS